MPGARPPAHGASYRLPPATPAVRRYAALRPPAAERLPNPPALLMSGPCTLHCTEPESSRRLPGTLRQHLAAKSTAGTRATRYGTPRLDPGHQETYQDNCSNLSPAPWPDRGPRHTSAGTARPGCGGHRGERIGEASHPGPPAASDAPAPADPLWAGDPWARGAAASRAARPPVPPLPPGIAAPPGSARAARPPKLLPGCPAPPPAHQQPNRTAPSPPLRRRPGPRERRRPPDGPYPRPQAKGTASTRPPATALGPTTPPSRYRSRRGRSSTRAERTSPGRTARLPS